MHLKITLSATQSESGLILNKLTHHVAHTYYYYYYYYFLNCPWYSIPKGEEIKKIVMKIKLYRCASEGLRCCHQCGRKNLKT